MDIPVAAAGLPLGHAGEPVEHQSDVQLSYALGFVVRRSHQIGEVVLAARSIAKDVPGEGDVVGALHDVGVAILSVPKLTVIDPDVFGAAFDVDVVPSLIGVGAWPSDHQVANDHIAGT